MVTEILDKRNVNVSFIIETFKCSYVCFCACLLKMNHIVKFINVCTGVMNNIPRKATKLILNEFNSLFSIETQTHELREKKLAEQVRGTKMEYHQETQ